MIGGNSYEWEASGIAFESARAEPNWVLHLAAMHSLRQTAESYGTFRTITESLWRPIRHVRNSSRAGVRLNPRKADVPDSLKTWATHW